MDFPQPVLFCLVLVILQTIFKDFFCPASKMLHVDYTLP